MMIVHKTALAPTVKGIRRPIPCACVEIVGDITARSPPGPRDGAGDPRSTPGPGMLWLMRGTQRTDQSSSGKFGSPTPGGKVCHRISRVGANRLALARPLA